MKKLNLDTQVLIARVANGWIIQYPDPMGEGTIEESYAFEEKCDEEEQRLEECKALERLLWAVKEGLGEYWQKHSAYNVEIRVVDENGKEVETD